MPEVVVVVDVPVVTCGDLHPWADVYHHGGHPVLPEGDEATLGIVSALLNQGEEE